SPEVIFRPTAHIQPSYRLARSQELRRLAGVLRAFLGIMPSLRGRRQLLHAAARTTLRGRSDASRLRAHLRRRNSFEPGFIPEKRTCGVASAVGAAVAARFH